MITMLLAASGTGAAWTFVAWGACMACTSASITPGAIMAPPSRALRAAGEYRPAFILTFLSVVVGMGMLSRRQPFVGGADPLEMAIRPQIAFGRGEMAYTAFIIVYAESPSGLPRTPNGDGPTITRTGRFGEALGAWPRRFGGSLCDRCDAGLGILGSPQHSEFIYFRF